MIIKSHLFSSGHFCQGMMIPDVLRDHKEKTIRKIKCMTCLDDMTPSLLEQVVKESVVPRMILKLEDKTKEMRNEDFRPSDMPFDMAMLFRDPYKYYPKLVARINVPFEGDPTLLNYCPSSQFSVLPMGRVSGNKIEFDVVFWRENDSGDAKASIADNLDRIERYFEKANDDIKKFNESLPKEIEEAFVNKFEQLEKQIAALDDLGIANDPEKSNDCNLVESPAQKRQEQMQNVILQIRNLYVENFNQTNTNSGDVNNAVQST